VNGSPDNDDTIGDHEDLLRRIPASQMPFNALRGRPWPSSAAFVPSDDGDAAVSVYLRSVLRDENLTDISVIDQHHGYGIVRFPVRVPRSFERGITRDPCDDPARRPLVRDQAHALVKGLPTEGTKRWRALGRRIFAHPECRVILEPSKTDAGPD